MSKIKYCGSCALRSQDGVHCGLTQMEINPDTDFCSHHNQSPHKCEICGKFIVSKSVLDPDENLNYHEICYNCFKALRSCPTCDQIRYCEFETNSSTLPKVVNQQVRQGNMVMQTQVRNPERIKITCAAGCKCWDGKHCCRENNSCDKHNHTYS